MRPITIILPLIVAAVLVAAPPGPVWAQTIPAPLPEPIAAAQPGPIAGAQPSPATLADITLQQWRQAWRGDAPLNAFAFHDPQNGIAVGDAGRILLTGDGGQSWQPAADQTMQAWHLQTVAYAANDTIYAGGGRHIGPLIGSTGGLLVSTDGGRSWQRRLSMPRRVWTVLARGRHVLACAEPDIDLPSGLMFSTDGGANWSGVADRAAGPVIAAEWVSDVAALLITTAGEIMLYNSAATPQLRLLTALDATLSAAHIRSLNHWFVALQDGTIQQTQDGGRTWRAATVTAEPLPGEIRDFIFTGQGSIGYALAAGARPTYFTRDGGQTWQTTGRSPGSPVRALFFHDAWNGLAAGAFGSIYRTTDGGGLWTPVAGEQTRPAILAIAPLGDTDDLPLVSMLAGDRGYRAILWYITRPADGGLPLVIAERRLRDALLPNWGAAGLILGSQPSARREGRPLFDLQPAPALQVNFDDAEQAAITRSLLEQVLTAWQPAIVISPDAGSADLEAEFIGRVARQVIGEQHPAYWIRNGGVRIRPPQSADATGSPPSARPVEPAPARPVEPLARPLDPTAPADEPAAPADADEAIAATMGWQFMTVDPLVPSEVHGLHHGLLAARSAAIFRQQPFGLPAAVRYGRLSRAEEDGDGPPATMLMLAQLRAADPATRRDSPQVAVVPLAERQIDHQAARRMMTDLGVLLGRNDLDTALEMVEDTARARAAMVEDEQQQRVSPPRIYDLAQYAAREVARRAALAGRDDLALRGFDAIMPAAVPTWQQLNTSLDPRNANWIAESLLWQMQTAGSLELRRLRAAVAAQRAPVAQDEPAGTGASPPPPGPPTLTQVELATLLAALQEQLATITGQTRLSHLALLRLTVEPDPAIRADLLATLNETLELLPSDLLWPASLHLWLATDRARAAPLPIIYLRRHPTDGLVEGAAEIAEGVAVQVIEQADVLNILIDRDLAPDLWLALDIDGDGSTVLAEPFLADADEPPLAAGAVARLSAGPPLWLRQPQVFAREAMGGQLALRLRYAQLGGRPVRGTIWLLSLRRQLPNLTRPLPWPLDGSQGFFAIVFE